MLHFSRTAQRPIARMPIRIAGLERESVVDGPGLRSVVFVQGCPHHCLGCHNPQTHAPDGGTLSATDEIWAKIAGNPLICGITFSGGEPFLWGKELSLLGEAAHSRGWSVLTYTGYTFERLLEMAETDAGVDALLRVTDLLIDGPFVQSQRSLELLFRGSTNQRVLNIAAYPNRKTAIPVSDAQLSAMKKF